MNDFVLAVIVDLPTPDPIHIFVRGAGLTNLECLRAIVEPLTLFEDEFTWDVSEEVPFQFQTAHANPTVNVLDLTPGGKPLK